MNKNKSQSPLPPTISSKDKKELSFPNAIEALIGGKKIKRLEWADEQEYCLLKDSFLMIHRNDKFHSWIVSEGDLLSLDWVVISESVSKNYKS